MTYPEALAWLYDQLPMFQRIGKAAYKADLNNALALSALLGNPEKQFKSIHVAGTNGKGSTSHALAAVFQQAGYKTGLYTSPHLTDFRERVRINGAVISEEAVCDFVNRYQSAFQSIGLSFFEMTVGLAFHHFATEKVDIAIIETGMGGRLDATNIITPELSVITNIGMDHAAYLGDTLEKIAFEKAGIIKPGVPVVIGEAGNAAVRAVFENRAMQQKSPIIFAEAAECPPLETDLKGSFQQRNMRTVYTALKQVKGFHLPETAILTGLQHIQKTTGLRGRWQTVRTNPTVICDTGHNSHALKETLPELEKITGPHPLHMVLGVVNDKDVGEMTALLPKDAQYYLAKPNVPRGLDVEVLSTQFQTQGLQHQTFESVAVAYEAALENAHPTDTIFVGGSTFVVADFLMAQS